MIVWILWDNNTAANDCGHKTLLGIYDSREEAEKHKTNKYVNYWLEAYRLNK